MLGAIAGDIIGSRFEHAPIRTTAFALFADDCRFTDDTVCTVAVADCLMRGGDFADYLGRYALLHPKRGYGGMFARWAAAWERKPYGSWGNGAAMRVGALAWLARDEAELLAVAARSAAVTHDHPDAIAGAQATALAIWLTARETDIATIRAEVTSRFGYDLSQPVDAIRRGYRFDVSCAGTVPPAIVCALEATDYEAAVRNAVSLGGDADTLACIAGGIAEARFGVPAAIATQARSLLTADLAAVLDRFEAVRRRPKVRA